MTKNQNLKISSEKCATNLAHFICKLLPSQERFSSIKTPLKKRSSWTKAGFDCGYGEILEELRKECCVVVCPEELALVESNEEGLMHHSFEEG